MLRARLGVPASAGPTAVAPLPQYGKNKLSVEDGDTVVSAMESSTWGILRRKKETEVINDDNLATVFEYKYTWIVQRNL